MKILTLRQYRFFSKTERIDLKIEKAIEEAKEKKVSAETDVSTSKRL